MRDHNGYHRREYQQSERATWERRESAWDEACVTFYPFYFQVHFLMSAKLVRKDLYAVEKSYYLRLFVDRECLSRNAQLYGMGFPLLRCQNNGLQLWQKSSIFLYNLLPGGRCSHAFNCCLHLLLANIALCEKMQEGYTRHQWITLRQTIVAMGQWRHTPGQDVIFSIYRVFVVLDAICPHLYVWFERQFPKD
jgi:hypothetical protein